MTRRRRRGTGTIEQLTSGRYVARLPTVAGRRGRRLGESFDTEREATDVLDAYLEQLIDERLQSVDELTLRGYGARWLDRREAAGYRSIQTDRYRWRDHVMSAHFADWPIERIRPRDVRRWLDELATKRAMSNGRTLRRRLSAQTIRHARNLLSRCLADAMLEEIIRSNPTAGLRVETRRQPRPWDHLTPDEIDSIERCVDIAEPDRLRILFAVGTGLRQGEQYALELADLDVDGEHPSVLVRFGAPGHQPPKHGKIRRVPLFGVALRAARRWLELLPDYCRRNPRGLVWPTRRGSHRRKSKTYGWPEQRAAAGITRAVRWHELRHTCGTALVQGWWGRRWTLEEVRDVLGHSTVRVTERYAHLGDEALRRAARETDEARSVEPEPMASGDCVDAPTVELEACAPVDPEIDPRCDLSAWDDDRMSRPVTPEAAGSSPVHPASEITRLFRVAPETHGSTVGLRDRAERVIRAIESGDPHRDERALELAGAVLEATAVKRQTARNGGE